MRLQQEIVLGIGGWRLLGALGIRPEVCHLNEGHAAFAVLEYLRPGETVHLQYTTTSPLLQKRLGIAQDSGLSGDSRARTA